MERKLVYNAIRTPDGTLLVSKYRHDFVAHTDKNGEIYQNDGGIDYIRRTINKIPAEDLSLYTDSPHEKIREVVERGTYGKEENDPFKYVILKDIDDDWLDNIILYEQTHRPENPYLKIYLTEKEFRDKDPFELYLIILGERSTDYSYTPEMIYKNLNYFKRCWENNLSCYKALEFFSFEFDDKK